MVFPAVLRDSALDARHPLHSSQARRRDGDVRSHSAPGAGALARQLQGALGELQAALSAILLGAGRRLRRAWLYRLQGGDAGLSHGWAHLYRLLLLPFPDRPAAARSVRDAKAPSELDFR